MLSLLAQRVALRAPACATPTLAGARSLPLSAACVLAARRTFLSAAPVAHPVKDTTTTGKKSTTGAASPSTARSKKDKAATEGEGTKAKAKTAKPAKEAAPKKKVVKKEEPKKLKVTSADKPPKGPPSPYLIFAGKFRTGRDLKSPGEVITLAKETAVAWKELTELEKQAFRKEYDALREDYLKRREEYWATIDPAIVREMNKQRKSRGRQLIHPHKPAEARRPASPYIRFSKEQFATAPGSIPSEKAAEIGRLWRGMSDAEKKPYYEASEKEVAEWKKRHPEGTQHYT